MNTEQEQTSSAADFQPIPRSALICGISGTVFSILIYLFMPSSDLTGALLLLVGLIFTGTFSVLLAQSQRRANVLESELEACIAELNATREGASLAGATDPVTGLLDRTYFNNVAANECRRAVREFSPLSMMLLDVDYLQAYREQHGEEAANLCLEKIAATLNRRVSRPGDLAVRFDEHRFALLLPSTNEQVAQLAEHCCGEVRQLAIPHGASAVSDVVTVTVGVATLQPSRMLTPERLVEACRGALYDAQKSGRDCYVASAEDMTDLPSVTYSL